MSKKPYIISTFSGKKGELPSARLVGSSGGGGGSVTVDSALSTSSTNPVQNKAITSKINQMDSQLGELDTWLGDKLDAPIYVTVSGSDVTITPIHNRIYECGELTSLTINNPPANGAYSIVFFSGAAPTTTVGIENFAAEANKRYKITVEDNYATYDSWPYTPT
jgi:hypothetical protein